MRDIDDNSMISSHFVEPEQTILVRYKQILMR